MDGATGAPALASFGERMEAFLIKALREAKTRTSWVNPDEAYEGAATGLLRRLLEPEGRFLREFAPLARRLAVLGMLTGLSRTMLKCTLPGVPDIYQGGEFLGSLPRRPRQSSPGPLRGARARLGARRAARPAAG